MPPTTNQVRKIIINIDANGANGLKDVADKLGGVNKNTREMANSFRLASLAAVSFFGLFSVREIASFSDDIQVLNNRLVALTGSQTAATATLNQLTQVSRDTNQSLDSTAQTYLTIALSTKAANLSTATLIDLTKTLTNTFRLSGASADEAASATKSLALGFQLGGIQGRELRTIMRQNTVLAGLLRKEFGSQLKSDAQLGFLTVGKLMGILQKNMGEVNAQASVLTATFGQSLTKVLDAVKLKLYDISTAINGPGGAAAAVEFIIKHLSDFAVVGSVLALTTIPRIISAVKALATSLLTINPYIAVAGFELLLLYFTSGAKDATEFFLLIKLGFLDIEASIDRAIAKFFELSASITIIKSVKDSLTKQAAAYRNSATDIEVHSRALLIEADAQATLADLTQKSGDTTKRWADDIKKANDKLKFDVTPKEQLAALNRELERGLISLSRYNELILKLDLKKARREFHDGAEDAGKFHDQIRAVDLAKVNREFKDGALTIDQFNTAIRGIGLDKLKEDLESGKISLADFNSKLAAVTDKFSTGGAFRTGLQDYLNSIGTTTQQVANAIKSAFSGVEDVFVNFVKNGKFEFDKFTQAVLEDLTRIIVRATIIQPIANGILNGLNLNTAGAGPAYSQPAYTGGGTAVAVAKGAVFDHGLSKFANGGIVHKPTMFGYGNGQTGLMGEKGAEAILPLQRGSGGSLGVAASVTPVNINIINNASVDVAQRETTGPSGSKTIEVLITNKVREGLASGSFDKVFHQSYGLRRKGS